MKNDPTRSTAEGAPVIPIRSAVSQAIAFHLAAVHTDEASFTDDGKPISEALAEATGKAEAEAFAALVREPCRSAADVQAKLTYVIHGTVGGRTPNVDGILGDDGANLYDPSGPLLTFLQSLVIDAA